MPDNSTTYDYKYTGNDASTYTGTSSSGREIYTNNGQTFYGNANPIFATESNDDSLQYYGGRVESSLAGAEAQLIRGTMSFNATKLKQLDPSYTGYTHIFVLRMPKFMQAIAEGRVLSSMGPNAVNEAREHCNALKSLIEMGSTSYDGTPSLTMNTTQVNMGYNERSYVVPLSSAYDSTSFNITALETRGEALRHAQEYYISGITDPNVKATMLHGALNDAGTDLMHPTLDVITMSILVVQTAQTLRTLQDVSLWNNCNFTEVDRSNLNWDLGTVDIVQPRSISFSGMYMPDGKNSLLEKKAVQLLGKRLKTFKRFKDMDEDDLGVNDWTASHISATSGN